MKKLLPKHLRELWKSVEQNRLSEEEFRSQQQQSLTEIPRSVEPHLLLEGNHDFFFASF